MPTAATRPARRLAILLLAALALAAAIALSPGAAYAQDRDATAVPDGSMDHGATAVPGEGMDHGSMDRGGDTEESSSLLTPWMFMGVGLLALGGLLMAVSLRLGGWYTRKGAGVMAGGLVGFAAGVALVVSSLPGGDDQLTNPIPSSEESIRAGLEVYEVRCLSCHGETGQGDGRAAAGMEPPPSDLRIHAYHHPDAELFGIVRDGVPDTAMTQLGDALTADEIWHVINYIQTFE